MDVFIILILVIIPQCNVCQITTLYILNYTIIFVNYPLTKLGEKQMVISEHEISISPSLLSPYPTFR